MPKDTSNAANGTRTVYSRRHERVLGKIQAKLVTKLGDQTGPAFFGFTKDLSLNGLFIEFLRQPSAVKTGDRAVVELGTMRDKRILPCTIAHVSKRGVGVEVAMSPSEFGKILSFLLFSENQLRLGMELAPREQKKIVLQCDDGVSLGAWLDKISTSQLECVVEEDSPSVEVGQAVTLSITGISGLPLLLLGVVRKVQSHVLDGGPHGQQDEHHGTESRVAVLFSSMSGDMVAEIKALVKKFHQNRLDLMMKSWTSSLEAVVDEEMPKYDMEYIGQQLNNFFGGLHPNKK